MNYLFINGFRIFSLRITFYAICILIGAITAYKLSQHFLKKRGYNPEDIENLFYVAFPGGIIGSRIWYVIAQWNAEFAGQPFEKIFKVWEGGLAIQGGVIGGVLVGVLFMIFRRKHIPVLLATDCIVPTILPAQAIGRWGNYFNQEVYGECVAKSKYWFMPDFMKSPLIYAANKGDDGLVTGLDKNSYLCGSEDYMVRPLFLIEGTLNLIGFFVIAFGIPSLFKFLSKKTNGKIHLADGDLMCSYLIWYGIVRFVLEPLRNTSYQMGMQQSNQLMKSQWMALAFIIVGVVGIVLCHLYAHFKPKKAQPVAANGATIEATDVEVKDIKEENTEEASKEESSSEEKKEEPSETEK